MKYFALLLIMAVCFCITVLVVKKPVLNISLIKYKGRVIRVRVESFWLASLVIPVILLAVGAITPLEVLKGVTVAQSMNPIKILVLFMSMCFISVMLDKAGFFEYCALKVMSRIEKGQFRLFIVFYAVVSVLTIFTSNDIIILTFTPFIYYFSKNAGINPVPYIIAEFVAANTWSLVLIIGNPTNIYIASSMGITFIEYLKVMALPGVAAGLSAFFMLVLIFRHQLELPLTGTNLNECIAGKMVLKDKTMAAISLGVLALCVVTLTFGSYVDVEMWIVSLFFAVLLLVVTFLVNGHRKYNHNHIRVHNHAHNHNYNRNYIHNLDHSQNGMEGMEAWADTQYYVSIRDVFGSLPFALVPFLLSMFIAVLTLDKYGITDAFSRMLFPVTNSPLDAGLLFGFASALCSNIINNIPMSILFTNVLSDGCSSLYSPLAIYSTIIGSNIGAFFSPIGALAGVMLMKILKEKGDSFTALSFIRYCAPVAMVSLVVSVLTLLSIQ
jgi:arsenical pump membrane protein